MFCTAQVALATRECFKEARSFPSPGAPTLDGQGRLAVGAAVGTREVDKERVAQLRCVCDHSPKKHENCIIGSLGP